MQTLLWIAGAYLAICLLGYLGNRLFMYFPDPARFPPAEMGLEGVREIELTAADGTRLVAWYAPARGDKPTLLYFHGNAGNAAGRADKIEMIRAGGYGVFYLNNRGYGGSAGRPSEAANVADAITAYEHLRSLGVPPRRIVLYGESLGSGQAILLAAQREVRAVVLEAPLTSTVDVARSIYWFLPLRLIIADTYDNEKNVSRVHVPLLVLHGERDEVIPVEMGRRVFAAAKEPKRLELFPAGAHSDLFDHGAWERADAFLSPLPAR